MEHELKIAPPWFAAVASGAKTAEVRRDDRGYDVGDTLILHEWDGSGETGRTCRVLVTHVLRHEDVPHLLPPGVVVLSVQRLDDAGAPAPSGPTPAETEIARALQEIRDRLVWQTAWMERWLEHMRDQAKVEQDLAEHVARFISDGHHGASGTKPGPWWKRRG
jgi:hypothetical protein